MRSRRARFGAALALVLLLQVAAVPVAESVVVFDPTNWVENLLNRLQTYVAILQRLTKIYNQSVQIRNQVEKLRWMYHNIRFLAEDGIDGREVATLLYNVQALLETGDAIVYTLRDVDLVIHESFPVNQASGELRLDLRRRADAHWDTIRGLYQGAARLGRNSVASQQRLGAMKEQLLAADGHLKAQQAAGLLTAYAAEESSKGVEASLMVLNALLAEQLRSVSDRTVAGETFDGWMAPPPARPYAAYPALAALPR